MNKQDNKHRTYSTHPGKQHFWKCIAFADNSGERLWGEKEWHRGIPTSSTSAAWLRSPAPRLEKWDLQWEQCEAQLCLQGFRDDIITPGAERSGAPSGL